MTQPTTLDQLAFALEKAKAEESAAKANRLKIEDAIAAEIGVKDEGTTTQKTEFYKISTTGGVTRKITDLVQLMGAAGELSNSLVRTKHELNTTQLKAIRTGNPDLYIEISRFIETTPRKPSIKVEQIEAKNAA